MPTGVLSFCDAHTDRSAQLSGCAWRLTVRSFAPADTAPVKRWLVAALSEAHRRSEICEDDKLRLAARTLLLLGHLEREQVTSCKAYVHGGDGGRWLGLIDERYRRVLSVDLGRKYRVASDGLVEQVDGWSKIQRGTL